MDLYLLIATVLINGIAIGIVYQFIKKMEGKQKLIIIAMSIALMYILVSITYWISGFGIEEKIHEQTKNFIIYNEISCQIKVFIVKNFIKQMILMFHRNSKPQCISQRGFLP